MVVVFVFDFYFYDSISGMDKFVFLFFGFLILFGLMFNIWMGGCG